MRTYLLLCLSLIHATTGLPASAQELTDKTRVEELMSRGEIPGLGLAVVSSNGVNVHIFGDARVGEKTANEETIFEAASLTKPVVAYIVMRLVEQGKLKLDDSLIAILPSLPLPKEDSRSKLVTVRMALSHMSGLEGPDNQTLSFAENPGTKFRYYPAGYRLVQRVVEHLETSDLETIAKREVFSPLGMDSSSLVYKPESANRLATRHNLLSEPIEKVRDAQRPANAAASLFTTAGDYGRFLKEMLMPTGLQEKTVNMMLQPQIEVDDTDGAVAWGVGWGLEPMRGTFFHWGDDGAAKCFTIGSRSKGQAMVYFTNSFHGMCIADDMARRLIDSESPAVEWLDYHKWDSVFRTARQDILRAFVDEGPEAGLSLFNEYQKAHSDLDMSKIARWMSWLLGGRSLYAERITMLNWQVERDPENLDLYLNLLQAHQGIDSSDVIQSQLAKELMPLALRQEDDVVLNNVAWFFAMNPDGNGRYLRTEDAVEVARKACKISPDNANWKNTLGATLFRNGNYDEAIEVCNESVNQGFDVVYNWLFLAMSHWRLNDFDEAKKWHAKSMEWKTQFSDQVSGNPELKSLFSELEKTRDSVRSR